MIFVDVGAHEGQTLEEAVRYDFERLVAFEPMPAQFARLVERFDLDQRVVLDDSALTDADGPVVLYGSNDQMEASIYPEKEDVSDQETVCRGIRASDFFATLEGPIFLKLNCEGAEVPILNDLISSGEIWKAESILCDFDVRRIPGMQQGEQETLAKLGVIGYDRLVLGEDVVPKGRERRAEGTYRYTRRDEIMCWLKSHGIAER